MQDCQAGHGSNDRRPRIVLENAARRVFLSADGRVAAVENSGLGRHGVTVLAVPSGEVLWRIDAHAILTGLSADGERLFIEGYADNALPFYAEARGGQRTELFRLGFHHQSVDAEWSPGGRYLHLEAEYAKYLIDGRTGQHIDMYVTAGGWFAFAADESFFLANHHSLTRYNLADPPPAAPAPCLGKPGLFKRLLGLGGGTPAPAPKGVEAKKVWASSFPGSGGDVALSPDGRFALTAGSAGQEKGEVRLWDVESGRCLRVCAADRLTGVSRVAFLAGGRVAAAWTRKDFYLNSDPVLWDLARGVVPRRTRADGWPAPYSSGSDLGRFRSLAVSRDGDTVLFSPLGTVACVPTSWPDLEPLFPASAPCPWCKTTAQASALACPGCARPFADLYEAREAPQERRLADGQREYQPISAERIAALVAALEGSHTGGDEGYRDDTAPADWAGANAELVAAGPVVVGEVVRGLVRAWDRSPTPESTMAWSYLMGVLREIGADATATVARAVTSLPEVTSLKPWSAGQYVRNRLEPLLAEWRIAEQKKRDTTPEF